MYLGRPPKNDAHEAQVGKFTFNTLDAAQRRLAKYLLHAPDGTRAMRMLDLVVLGYDEHLQKTGGVVNKRKALKKPRTVVIYDIQFDMTNATHACCVAYLRAAQFRARRQRVIGLMLAGYAEYVRKESQEKTR